MRREERTIPFSDVLAEVFKADPVPVHLLFYLSDMTEEEARRFETAWAEADEERRRVVMRHLADIVEESYFVDYSPLFQLGLDDTSAPVRVAALDGLWDSTDARFVPQIIRMMQSDGDTAVRTAAASALAHYVLLAEWGQMPARVSRPIVEALLAAYLADETAVSVKRAALEALGAAHHPQVKTLIQEAYNSGDFDMQVSAIFAMGNTADPRWLNTILDEFDSHEFEMRAEAARAAGAMGRSDAVAPLTELLEDEDSDVRVAAIIGLGRIGGEQVQAILAELMEDPDHEDAHELIEETLEELLLLGGELSLLDYLEGEDQLPDDVDDEEL